MFETENTLVPNTVYIPYEGKVTNVTMIGIEEKISFTCESGGITLKVPEWNKSKAPIGRVYKLI